MAAKAYPSDPSWNIPEYLVTERCDDCSKPFTHGQAIEILDHSRLYCLGVHPTTLAARRRADAREALYYRGQQLARMNAERRKGGGGIKAKKGGKKVGVRELKAIGARGAVSLPPRGRLPPKRYGFDS